MDVIGQFNMLKQNFLQHQKGKLYTHLIDRHVNFDLHRVWLDEAKQVATFPLYNLAGTLLGYQQYRPNGSKAVNNDPREGKYFTRKPSNPEPSYWGVESWNLSNTLFLVEGLFDAARLTSLGYSALAVFTNNPGSNFMGFVQLVQKLRPVVVVCDNDVAGIKLAKYGHMYATMQSGKDVSEADELELLEMVKYYDKL
jgi:5S rRNA maturation endonuclease (ribonuclease M5)